MATAGQKIMRAEKLCALLKKDEIIVCPGVYDGLSARVARACGFKALYMTGAGVSMSKLGWADLGLATLNDMAGQAAMLASLDPNTPLIADADTGYGGPVMVARTVAQYARAGVAALHIEDQVQEKRCGHLLGKEIVSCETYYSRIRAAVATRDKLKSKMQIIARTDARQAYGFDEAIERLREAVRLGADIAFLEAIQSKDEAKRTCELLGNTPCLLNMVPGGVTPMITPEEAHLLGFRIVIFPGACLAPVLDGLTKGLTQLKNQDTMPKESDNRGPRAIFELCGLKECIETDKAAGGRVYSAL